MERHAIAMPMTFLGILMNHIGLTEGWLPMSIPHSD
jgi:hypothetical protein